MLPKSMLAGSNIQYLKNRFDNFVKAQKRLGISKIDLYASVPHIWCDHISMVDTSEISKKLNRDGLDVIAFTPKIYRYQLSSDPDSKEGHACLRYYQQCLEAARQLNSPLMVINTAGGCFDYSKDVLLNNTERTLKKICESAGTYGVTVLITTADSKISPILNTYEELSRMIDRIKSPSLSVLADTHTLSVQGENLSQWFGEFGKKIKLIRFVDGNYNGCRVWGEGCLPCGKLLDVIRKYDYNGNFSLQMSGEKYLFEPYEADRRNLRSLERYFN